MSKYTQELGKNLSGKRFEKNKKLAIDWRVSKVRRVEGSFPEEKENLFRRDIADYIDALKEVSMRSAVICTSETFINKKRGGISLLQIFQRAGIKRMREEMISITINDKDVLVVENRGGKRYSLL